MKHIERGKDCQKLEQDTGCMQQGKQKVTPMPKDWYCVTDFKTYSTRVIKMEINLQGKDSVTVINADALTSNSEDKKVDHDDIERAMADSDSKYKIITGDFTANTGTKTKEEDFKGMGA